MIAPLLFTVAMLVNPNFDDGLRGWKAEGAARVENGALILGPKAGAVRQRYAVLGLRVLYFGASVKGAGSVRVQCFDARNRPLMDLRAASDAKGYPAIYLKTQADTASVVLSIEKTSEGGAVVADDALLKDDDRDRVERAPTVDLGGMMRPIWQGDEVLNESVLLLSKDGPASGRLMFRPSRVLAVKDATLGTNYVEGRDYAVEGGRIVALKGSAIPTMRDDEIKKGEFPWTELQGRHVFVTYRHADAWNGPVPTPQGDRLPLTLAKLKAKKPLTIVAYGDSITQGVSVSGFRNVPPYLPPWPALVAFELARAYGNPKIRMVNAALGGQTSAWARDNARDAVAALRPDLVLLAFGMNDFWSLKPEEFRANLEVTMATIRARSPKCEFVLVASMRFDPAYTADPTYVGNFDGYARELRKMAGPGVALFDMTALSEALYRAKSQKDLGTDPMHPDDFLSRWYAQGMVATLQPPERVPLGASNERKVAPTPVGRPWGRGSSQEPITSKGAMRRLPKGFLSGGDPSEIPEVEASGAAYVYQGEKTDPFVAMRKAGWNWVRFRVWSDGPNPGKGGTWCDKAHTLALAKRAKAQGLKISLDFHYSDWWADPGKQTKPAAWKDLPFDDLVKAIHKYTKDVVGAMVAQGTPPIMVQIGNEITPGMLWPDGRNDTPEGWHRLGRLVAAGCRAVKESGKGIQTMIHLDRGGDNKGCRWWFDHLKAEGVDFDLIGLSYYPWWHGTLDDLCANLADLSERYKKDLYVVETSYPFEPERGAAPGRYKGGNLIPEYPASPEGQAAYLRKLMEIVRASPHGRGKGLLYWAPAWIGAPGRQGGWSGLILFDHDGKALPGFDALGGK